ncbi:MAG: trehalase family glycosidase [Chlamydiota bacterium]
MKINDYIQLSGPLFEAVQNQKVFPDAKTFVDATPKDEPTLVLQRYQVEKNQLGFNLKAFVLKHFDLPDPIVCPALLTANMATYISQTWDVLFRDMSTVSPYSTLIPLPHPHPIPGERFREGFYWDSYFTALGLAVDAMHAPIRHIADNFASLIERFGFIPNGNRIYFLSRSQPPFFSLLLNLLEEIGEQAAALSHFSALEAEYLFWMQGKSHASPKKPAAQHVVWVDEGKFLNRYWDSLNTPRPEAYTDELALGKQSDQSDFYRQRRAACASGWDFSSRWFTDPDQPETLCTLDLLPVDLNALLYHAEQKIAQFAATLGQQEKEHYYHRLAEKRKKAIQTLFWDEKRQFFFDYHWKKKELSRCWSLAAVTPLFVKSATEHQARLIADQLQQRFLLKGGFVTTLHETTHQWDAPNGWAPLQWMAIQGLINYGYDALAKEAATCWLDLNETVYQQEKSMLEKYNVGAFSAAVTRGLYQPQRGFGWTNGVALALMNLLTPMR